MRYLRLTALTLLVSVLACGTVPDVLPSPTPTETALPPTATAAPPEPDEPTPTPRPTEEPVTGLQADGQLAVIGVDGNVYLYERGRERIALTTDAGNAEGDGTARFYTDPTWSPDGWLSYVRLSFVMGAPEVDVLAQRPDEGDVQTLLSSDESGYVYGYWSPSACGEGPDCGRFAFLMSAEGQVNFYLSTVGEAEPQTERLRVSGSHYYSWAPDGEAMLWFRDGEELSVYDVGTDSITQSIDAAFGFFQSPHWSPVDNRLLFVENTDTIQSRLTVAEGGTLSGIGETFVGFSAFSWSPDGERVALATGDDLPYERLLIANPVDGSTVEVAPISNILAFYWAPDGEKLAIVTIEEAGENFETRNGRRFSRNAQESEVTLVWYVADAASGDVVRLAQFLPTQSQLYQLQFFDQYAQSHQVWSPDSRYIAYAEIPGVDEEPVISLIDTSQPGRAPQQVTEGRSVVFSFR